MKNSSRRRKRYQWRSIMISALLIVILFTLWIGTRAAEPKTVAGNVDKAAAKSFRTEAVSHKNSGTAESDWQLKLVNPWNSIDDDFGVELAQLDGGHAVDKRCYEALNRMMDDCRAAGLEPLICSSYRSRDKQTQLYNRQVDNLTAQGYSRAEAEEEAGKSIAVPGTSEHQLGLAVDIVDVSNQNLDQSQEDTDVQQWLMKNSWRYGFILRYPTDKTELTGIKYEPWHYRYVGKEHAKSIYQQDICLEEYLEKND